MSNSLTCWWAISIPRKTVHRDVSSSYHRFGRCAALSLPSSSDEPGRNKKTVWTSERPQRSTERYSHRSIAEHPPVTLITDHLLRFTTDERTVKKRKRGGLDIEPRNLKLSSRFGWVVGFMLWPLCPLWRAPSIHERGCWVHRYWRYVEDSVARAGNGATIHWLCISLYRIL
jgi:hypothetical protein